MCLAGSNIIIIMTELLQVGLFCLAAFQAVGVVFAALLDMFAPPRLQQSVTLPWLGTVGRPQHQPHISLPHCQRCLQRPPALIVLAVVSHAIKLHPSSLVWRISSCLHSLLPCGEA